MINFLLSGGLVLISGSPFFNPDFTRLQQVLTQYGFNLRLELPPQRGTYGLLESNSKTIWINPVVFELGIAKPVLVHEAVHAAQSCAGEGKPFPLGLDLLPPPQTRRYFMRYHSYRRQLEAEAYTIQVQPNGIELVIKLLNEHC
jgi:hypothetical protein